MIRTITLSNEFERRLRGLTERVKQSNGVLFYRPSLVEGIQFCSVDGMFIISLGMEDEKSPEKRVEIVKEFLRFNKGYKNIEYLTRSREKLNGTKPKEISLEDLDYFESRIAENKEYLGMVVTPSETLVYGNDNPLLNIIQNHPFISERGVHAELKLIAKIKKYNLGLE